MALTIVQTPATCSLAQSPIVFSVIETSGSLTYNNAFQYIANLYYWTGSESNSGSVDYVLAKYPNTVLYGIFDFSRIINSTLVDLAQVNTSNVMFYKVAFGWQYLSGSSYVTSSFVSSSVYKALDGPATDHET